MMKGVFKRWRSYDVHGSEERKSIAGVWGGDPLISRGKTPGRGLGGKAALKLVAF